MKPLCKGPKAPIAYGIHIPEAMGKEYASVSRIADVVVY